MFQEHRNNFKLTIQELEMGINGRLLMGDGIWVNLYYMPEEWIGYLDQLQDKYPYLFEINNMDGVNRNSSLIFWGQTPTTLFPVDTLDRRPLIINNEEQQKLIRPVKEDEQTTNREGVFLNDEKIWGPSYGDFDIMLNDYYDQVEEKREDILNYVFSQDYELGEEYSEYDNEKAKLAPEEIDGLRTILSTPGYSLVGRWMTYHAD